MTEHECAVCGRAFLGRVEQRYCGRACQLEGARRAHYPEPETPEQQAARLAAAIARNPEMAARYGVSV